MATIIPHILRTKIGGDIQYPLKCSDLVACLAPLKAEIVYLNVYFNKFSAKRAKERTNAEMRKRYPILMLSWHPEKLPIIHASNAPWEGADNPLVVDAWVDAISHQILKACQTERFALRSVLEQQVHELVPNGVLLRPWAISMELLSDRCVVECTRSTWTGLRVAQSKVLLPLHDAQPS